MAEEKSKSYRVTLDGQSVVEASSAIATSSVNAARGIEILDAKAKAIRSTFSKLTGSSEEVKAAKAKLKEELDKTRAASNFFALAILKEGTNLDKATKAAAAHKKALKDVADQQKKTLGDSADRRTKKRDDLKKSGGLGGNLLAAKDAAKRFGELRTATGSTGGALKALASEANLGASGMNMLGSAASLGAAAAAAVAVAAAAAAIALVGWVAKAADAAAAANRLREALWGNAKDATALGGQITMLAGKVPQGTEELNKLALSLSKTKLSGAATVNTLNAVAQAAGAVDDAAGAKIQEIITRNQHMGRMHLGRRELQGTGLDFTDVAQAYAKVAKISVKQAQRDLTSGRATMERGAEAFRAAAEKKFSRINKLSAFSLANAPKKFFEQISSYAAGVDLTPVNQALSDVFDQLKPGSALGGAIKTTIGALGDGFVYVATKGIPAAVEGFKWLMIGALKAGIVFYELKKQVTDIFDKDGWTGLGKAALDGIVGGIKSGLNALNDISNDMGLAVRDAFKRALHIKSPSRVMFSQARVNVVGAVSKGLRDGKPEIAKAAGDMGRTIEANAIGPRLGGGASANGNAGSSAAGGAMGATTAGGGPTVIHLHFSNMTHAEASKIAADQNLLASMTRIAKDAVKSQGRSAA